jgi:hypothetical protein
MINYKDFLMDLMQFIMQSIFVLIYEDNIDRCAFFYELNIGWYDMYEPDDMGVRDPWNLLGRVTHLKVPEKDYDAIIKALEDPPKYMIGLANLMKRKLPYD